MKRAPYLIFTILLAFLALTGVGTPEPLAASAQAGLPTFAVLTLFSSLLIA